MRVLLLTTDAFGVKHGIAQYNRDFLTSLCSHPRCQEVTVIPRQAPGPLGVLPQKLRFITRGLNSKLKYAETVFLEVVGKAAFDLVVCGHINLFPFAFFASRWHRTPLVLMIYGTDAWQPHRNLLINALVKKVNSVVSISKITLDKFLAWSASQESSHYIIPNAIDLERFKPGQKSQALLERYRLCGKKVLVTVGRLAANERYKGVDEVLDLLPSLQPEAPDVTYLVMGDGDDRGRLEEKARHLGLTSQVVFTGYIAEEEKLAHYRLADVYVMPSRGEGFGFVFLEAMAAGIPVVASKVDGGREALRDGLLGVLVDPDRPDEIRRGIEMALHRPRGVVPEGLEYFSYDNFERRVHQFLDTVCNPVRSSSI